MVDPNIAPSGYRRRVGAPGRRSKKRSKPAIPDRSRRGWPGETMTPIKLGPGPRAPRVRATTIPNKPARPNPNPGSSVARAKVARVASQAGPTLARQRALQTTGNTRADAIKAARAPSPQGPERPTKRGIPRAPGLPRRKKGRLDSTLGRKRR